MSSGLETQDKISHAKENPMYMGHRERLREKFIMAKGAIPDYELLELLLFYVFPRKDTKVLARSLLSKFKTLHGVIFAEKSALLSINGIGESTHLLLQIMRELYTRSSLEQIPERPLMNSIDKVLEYYKMVLSDDIREQVRIMLIDNKSKLILEEQIQVGTVHLTAFYPREIVKKALDHGANGLIIVHNHPSGDPTPSKEDINMTKQLKKACLTMDIVLLDHIIIGANKVTSFHRKKIL